MAEALSQSQIDELLKKMQSGEVSTEEQSPKQRVKEYDFSSPKKFTKDQIKSMSNLYETFSRVISSYFTSILRTVCMVSFEQIEEQRYQEFNNALPDNTLVGMIEFKPDGQKFDESTIMMELPTNFGFMIIDRLLGGSGKSDSPDRDYTEIELALLHKVLDSVTWYFQEAWSGFFSLKTNLKSIETNGRLLQVYSPQDIVIIITMTIEAGDYKGSANICMDAENLDDVISSFSVKYTRNTKQQPSEHAEPLKELMLDTIKESELEIVAVLDRCEMSLSDIAMLQVSDVITLNKKIDSDISVVIEDDLWYTARLGESDGKKALKIVDTVAKIREG